MKTAQERAEEAVKQYIRDCGDLSFPEEMQHIINYAIKEYANDLTNPQYHDVEKYYQNDPKIDVNEP